MCWNLLRCITHSGVVGVYVPVYRSDRVTGCPGLSKQTLECNGNCVQINWSPGWHKQVLWFWVHSCDNTMSTAGDDCNISSCLCSCEWKMLAPMKWTCIFLSPDLFLSCLCQPFYQICWLGLQLMFAQKPCHWGWWGGHGWLLTSQSAGHKSWTWKLSGSAGASWDIYIYFFLLGFYFFWCLRTIPIIYVLHDTSVNTINKPCLVSLCNDECSSSSNCYHVYRSLFYYCSFPHMFCRWEESGFAVLFEIW